MFNIYRQDWQNYRDGGARGGGGGGSGGGSWENGGGGGGETSRRFQVEGISPIIGCSS